MILNTSYVGIGTMQLLSPQIAFNSSKQSVGTETEARASTASDRGFQRVFSEYTHQSGGEVTASLNVASGKHPESLPPGLQGQILPQRQTDTAPLGEAEQILSELKGTLDGLTATLEDILTLEQDTPDGETGPLTQFLVDELGFTDKAAADFINTLDTWVSEPPTVAMTAEALLAQGPQAIMTVEAMSESLTSLQADVNQWYQQVAGIDSETLPEWTPDSLAGMSNSEAVPGMLNAGLPLAGNSAASIPSERSMLDTLQQWSQALKEGPGGLSQLVVSIAERVKAVLNTAAAGSLPSTFDQSRPESALLTQDSMLSTDKSVPTADTLFSQLLQTGSAGSATDDSEAPALSRLTPLAAAVADDARQPLISGQPVPEKADAVNAVIQRSLQQPVLAGEAGRQLGERLALMVRGDIQQATIRLDPPELGLMDVRITVQNDQTQVQIVVQNPQVREALESQSVRLREFLEQQGLSLAKLDIRDESAGQQGAGSERDDESGGDTAGQMAADSETSDESATSVAWGQGLVDQFV
ncbi:flagellar hook-length control protein FliK [Saccharospirillum impatiens]|uniref:flagellar hook-length control protein FliK n=1 Tax=Saccharospirillum impatiens TaxID=169438 RepID=UPI00048C8F72|nr:flagellar hook-length control protein FliK [Saccharospirillum impatiens]